MIRPTPTPIESVPPEIVTIEVTVSEEQIRGGDSILIDDLRLASPLQLALRPGMKDGTRMRLQNAVFRDSGMASDSVAANFEQIFETYSPNTIRKVL